MEITKSSLSNYFTKYKLDTYNTVNIIYDIKNEDLNNILLKLKTLYNCNFKVLKVNSQYDSNNFTKIVKKYKLNKKLNNSVNNIFHTYEENTGFISYDKYYHKIIDIQKLDNNNIISIEQNTNIPYCNNCVSNKTFNLEYNFEFDNNIVIKIEHYIKLDKIRLIINIPILEEKYINPEKLDYINDLNNNLNLLINE